MTDNVHLLSGHENVVFGVQTLENDALGHENIVFGVQMPENDASGHENVVFANIAVIVYICTDMDKERIILGIDPGTQLLGFGVIRVHGKKAEYVDMGVLDLRKDPDAYTKLQSIYECISEVCKSYRPSELAIESPFYGKNAQVVLKLGRAQGAAILAAKEYGVASVTEYAPRKAKEAIVGNGAASKEQVQLMLEKTLGVKLESRHLDATDALAIALCHHYETSSPLASVKGKGGWEQFIKDNPDRVK